jgi:hypothetical protein
MALSSFCTVHARGGPIVTPRVPRLAVTLRAPRDIPTMRRALSVLLVATACASPDDRDLLARIEADDYRSWARAPEWPEPLLPADGGPHGAYLDMFVNDVVDDAVVSGAAIDEWPEGSIIAKDAYTDEQGDDLRFIALMEKVDGKWFWAEYRPDGEVAYAGLEDPTCTGCHDAGADGVLAFGFPE